MQLFFHYLGMPYLLEGILVTLEVTALGLFGGTILGLLLTAMQLSRFWVLSAIARTYTVIFRGTPLILQMVFFYDALPHIGIKLPAMLAAGLALACNEAPFIAEMLRAGVLGTDRGQIAAGQALGMTPWVLMRRVIAPQAIRTMIPAFGNEAVSTLKNSSLASVIAIQELTLRSTQLASSTFDFFSIFFASGLIYLVLTGAISVIQLVAEFMLDLDRGSSRQRLISLLPWHRAKIFAEASKPDEIGPEASDSIAELAPARPATIQRTDRAARAEKLANSKLAVEVRGIRKNYGEQEVLKGVDLTVRHGEVVALLGPSGSGKSTLLRCINRLETWNDGEVRVWGQRLGISSGGVVLQQRGLAMQRCEVGVGMVFQQFNLFSHLTALENVAGPLRWVHGVAPAEAGRRAQELLVRVGLGDRMHALPRHMSGGQQQRVAIARALVSNPNVLLLDEPTSALDPELVNEVLEVIRRLAVEDGLTMIISTHQLRFADEIADRVAFLSDGQILEEGPAHQILTQPRNPVAQRFLRSMDAEKILEVPA